MVTRTGPPNPYAEVVDGIHDEESLAYHDTLALDTSPSPPSKDKLGGATMDDNTKDQQDRMKKQKRRRLLIVSASLVLIGIVVLTAVLASTNDKDTNSGNNGGGAGSSSVAAAGTGETTVSTTTGPTTLAPEPTTLAPEPSVEEDPYYIETYNTVYEILKPIVNDPAKLDDPRTPEGQALRATVLSLTATETATATETEAATATSTEKTSIRDSTTTTSTSTSRSSTPSTIQDIINQYSLRTTYYSTSGRSWVNNAGWSLEQQQQQQLPSDVDVDVDIDITTQGGEEGGDESSNGTIKHHCDWYGVSCDGDGNVVSIRLDNNNLLGTLSPDLCLLNNLEVIIFSSNKGLEGTIPDCIGTDLLGLKELHANGCGFEGTIPPGLPRLAGLERLTLSFNRLSGGLFDYYQPQDQSDDVVFPSLRTMDLHDNMLSGTVPDSFLAKVSSLQSLTLHNNINLVGSMVETCPGIMLASADCDRVVCPCCTDGTNCPSGR